MKKQQRVVRQHEEGLHAVIQVVKDIVNQQDENQKSLSETLHKLEKALLQYERKSGCLSAA